MWHKSRRMSLLDRRHNMCPECKFLDSHLRQDAKRAAAVSSSVRTARTLPSSTYPISHLSPASQKTRTRRLTRERKHLAEQLSKYSSMCISLDQQDEEMAQTIHVDGTPDSTKQLHVHGLFVEADAYQEGHGSVIQEIWELDAADRNQGTFMRDQSRYRTSSIVMQ